MKTGLTQAGIFTVIFSFANIVSAGTITLDKFQDDTQLFGSLWTWKKQGPNGWKTAKATTNTGFLDPGDQKTSWFISLFGFANGKLLDPSAHATAPPAHKKGARVPLSAILYPPEPGGISLTLSKIAHDQHIDIYSLSARVIKPGLELSIFLGGEHLIEPRPNFSPNLLPDTPDSVKNANLISCFSATSSATCQDRTVVPLPPAIWLFGSGLLSMLYFRKKPA